MCRAYRTDSYGKLCRDDFKRLKVLWELIR